MHFMCVRYYEITYVVGCGGVIDLAAGQSSPISLQNYNTGLQCTWLVKVSSRCLRAIDS